MAFGKVLSNGIPSLPGNQKISTAVRSRTLRTGPRSKTGTRCAGKMSEEQAAAAEPIPEGKEPITLRVRDQVSKMFENGLTF